MEFAVQMKGITMQFPAVKANDNVDFEVAKGEIHALVGENGAGKSTLMNILYGLYQQTAGEVFIDGKVAKFGSALDAIKHGVGMVHQHFMLIPRLTVSENVILGAEPRKGAILDRKEANKQIQALSDKYGFNLDPTAVVEKISLGMKQRVEIAKALYREAPQEIDELGVMLKNLKAIGKTIIIITHKMQEIMDFSDRVTVLRAGKKVTTLETANTTANEITSYMVGREIHLGADKESKIKENIVLEFRNVCYKDKIKNISFTLNQGEILGIAGIDDSGQKEITELAAGVIKPTSGEVLIDGKDTKSFTIPQIKDMGIGFIPQDRHRHGLVLDMNIANNLILGYHKRQEFVKNKSL